MDNDSHTATLACLALSGADARTRAMGFSWQACAGQFLDANYESLGVAP
ncbi:hypothetical protein [Hoeflea sp.]